MKEVKIIGLSVNSQLGILQACSLKLDTERNLTQIKGGVGQGKTTAQKALQLGTQGSKTLIDNDLYGEVDIETQLIDGEKKIFVGCKTDAKGKLAYTLFEKDENGKKVSNPVIDGVSATPAKYLETLQTELTWRMDELTSENPSVQKKILLKLYQRELIKHGVIFDKSLPEFKGSILNQIEEAEALRDQRDYERKQVGGIKEDLVANGFDPDRPATCPDLISIEEIDNKIKALEKEKTTLEVQSESGKSEKLAKIKGEAAELVNKCLVYNTTVEKEYNESKAEWDKEVVRYNKIKELKKGIGDFIHELKEIKAISIQNQQEWELNISKIDLIDVSKEPTQPQLIKFNDKQQPIIKKDIDGDFFFEDILSVLKIEEIKYDDKEIISLLTQVQAKREAYFAILNDEIEPVDTKKIDSGIQALNLDRLAAEANNKTVKAIDSFHAWRDSNETVVQLKNDYAKLLGKVDTGVEGLQIVPKETGEKLEIFLMYDGSYNPKYFNNPEKEMRKLSSYSGTQKPVICLLIQKYLLDKKPKAMRYIFIDNIPVDDKTIELLDEMGRELNLHILMNITGTFDKSDLKDGEILIDGGEVFFS